VIAEQGLVDEAGQGVERDQVQLLHPVTVLRGGLQAQVLRAQQGGQLGGRRTAQGQNAHTAFVCRADGGKQRAAVEPAVDAYQDIAALAQAGNAAGVGILAETADVPGKAGAVARQRQHRQCGPFQVGIVVQVAGEELGQAGIGAHGLWSVSRGLARGLESRGEYKRMMDRADSPRDGDLDGRGNLSEKALVEFTSWFLQICIDQVRFMSEMFDLDTLGERYRRFVWRQDSLKPESAHLLVEALVRGQLERGEAPRITGLPERTARRVLNDVVGKGLLGSRTPKGPVSLRFPADVVDELLPKLYPVS